MTPVKKVVCAFCLGKHVSSSCTKFAKTKENREVLQKYNKCFSCLQKGHIGLRNPGEQNCAANARKGSIMNRYVMETIRKREHL